MGNNVSSANRPKKQRASRKVKTAKTPKKRFSLTPQRQVGADPATSSGLRRLSLGSSNRGKQPVKNNKFGLSTNSNKRDRRRSSAASTGSFGKLKAMMSPNTATKKQKKSRRHSSTTDRVMDKLSPTTNTAQTSKARRSSVSNPFKKQPKKQRRFMGRSTV
ncbi:hypothetical protein BD560DRAFT_492982 [Blakeslea trispora]|nr:hypothetical protein BD560DRAFT_492982 [Blakeslea trispora]